MKTYVHFLSYRGSFLLRMKSVADKSYRKSQNTHLMFNNIFFFENRAVCEKMWRNIVERGRPQMTK
jgi:hypothetical protein